jgi:hypothetical protein
MKYRGKESAVNARCGQFERNPGYYWGERNEYAGFQKETHPLKEMLTKGRERRR